MGYHESTLRQYEAQQDQAILDGLAIEQRQRELAADYLASDKLVLELMTEEDSTGLDVAGQIVRGLRSLDQAAKGDRTALDALVSCFHNMQQTLRAEAMRACLDIAARDVLEY